MGEHHALGPSGGTTGVIQRGDICLRDVNRLGELGVGFSEQIFVVDCRQLSTGRFVVPQVDIVRDDGELIDDEGELVGVFPIDQYHFGFGVLQDIGELGCGEAIIERHEHCPQLRHGKKRFEHAVAIGR